MKPASRGVQGKSADRNWVYMKPSTTLSAFTPAWVTFLRSNTKTSKYLSSFSTPHQANRSSTRTSTQSNKSLSSLSRNARETPRIALESTGNAPKCNWDQFFNIVNNQFVSAQIIHASQQRLIYLSHFDKLLNYIPMDKDSTYTRLTWLRRQPELAAERRRG